MSKFYAYLDRMKYINRWGLMRNTRGENIAEHSQQTAIIAHALALIDDEMYGGAVDCQKTALYALYHECSEVITGDLPTPVKYFSGEITAAYKGIENHALDKLLSMLPEPLDGFLADYLKPDKTSREYLLVKAADRLGAYIKCVGELRAGNDEFKAAFASTEKALKEMKLNCVDYFIREFIPAYNLTIDELL